MPRTFLHPSSVLSGQIEWVDHSGSREPTACGNLVPQWWKRGVLSFEPGGWIDWWS